MWPPARFCPRLFPVPGRPSPSEDAFSALCLHASPDTDTSSSDLHTKIWPSLQSLKHVLCWGPNNLDRLLITKMLCLSVRSWVPQQVWGWHSWLDVWAGTLRVVRHAWRAVCVGEVRTVIRRKVGSDLDRALLPL